MIPFKHSYPIDEKYSTRVAYLCMEFAIHQPLKVYAGGLGYLAGSHMRSAYELKQNMVGVGILWKYGYYDQVRKNDQRMDVLFQEKCYGLLVKTDITFTISVSKHDVKVVVWYLPSQVFQTAPIFFLSTDTEENDYLAKTITHRLYDGNPETQIAAAILLGTGATKLFELLDWEPSRYHLNESHALPIIFSLYARYKNTEEVRKRLVFTNHTTETAGNQRSNIYLLEKMGFFAGITLREVRQFLGMTDDILDYTQVALRFARIANGVSRLHHEHLLKILNSGSGLCPIIQITNAQNFAYWADAHLYKALKDDDDESFMSRKRERKNRLFEEVADQNGELYDPGILTMVFARRFAGYKRLDLLLHNMTRFEKIITNKQWPVQIIWAGKPYPMDYTGIGTFDRLVNICKQHPNCSILIGYELKLSRLLKQGADLWLNVPRITHEASGTSGMSAAMNGAINVSIPDGWFPEFARDNLNSFVIPPANSSLPDHEQDEADASSLYSILEQLIIPMYYEDPKQWLSIMKSSMNDIILQFDSTRMAHDYYYQMYNQ